jgi:hypothetical protein
LLVQKVEAIAAKDRQSEAIHLEKTVKGCVKNAREGEHASSVGS